MASAIMERDPVVEPKLAPPVPKCDLYTATTAASSVRVRSNNMILLTRAQYVLEQQEFIMRKRGKVHIQCMFFVLFGNVSLYS